MPPYAPAVISLLKGVVDENRQDIWQLILRYEPDIRQYFRVIGLDVYIETAEKYAFLKQKEYLTDEEQSYPKLIEERQLSYPASLLCVQLRKALIEAETLRGETRIILTQDQIVDMMRIFFPETSNESKIRKMIESAINRVEKYGFLRKLHNTKDRYEIKRILIAKLSAETLQKYEQTYREYAEEYAKSHA